MSKKFIDRKELAQLSETSYDVVRKNEDRWGIAEFRRDWNRRGVRFLRQGALRVLQEKGII